MTPIATWVLADSRMPATAIISMITDMPVAMATLETLFVVDWLNTARTEGASTTTGLSVPIKVPAAISQPVRNPR